MTQSSREEVANAAALDNVVGNARFNIDTGTARLQCLLDSGLVGDSLRSGLSQLRVGAADGAVGVVTSYHFGLGIRHGDSGTDEQRDEKGRETHLVVVEVVRLWGSEEMRFW